MEHFFPQIKKKKVFTRNGTLFSPNEKKKVFTRNGTLFSPNSGEHQKKTKKKVFTRNGTLFLSTDLRSDAQQSQIIGGNADEDHTQIVGGYTVKSLGGYIPHPPLFRHHCIRERQNELE